MSTIFDVLDESAPLPTEPDLNWRPWHGQVPTPAGWDAYSVEAENIARASSSPDMVRAAHGLPLSRNQSRQIPYPCDRCQRMRLEIVAVCHAHNARNKAELHHSDAAADLPHSRWGPVMAAAAVFMVLWFGHFIIVELGHALFGI